MPAFSIGLSRSHVGLMLALVAFFMGAIVGALALGSLAWWQWCLAAVLLVVTALARFLLPAGMGSLVRLAAQGRCSLPSLAFLLVLTAILLGVLKLQPGVLIGHFDRDWSITRILFFLLVPFLLALLVAFALAGSRGSTLLYGLLAWAGAALIIILLSRTTILAERAAFRGAGAADLVANFAVGMGILLTVLAAIGGLVPAGLGALASWWLAHALEGSRAGT